MEIHHQLHNFGQRFASHPNYAVPSSSTSPCALCCGHMGDVATFLGKTLGHMRKVKRLCLLYVCLFLSFCCGVHTELHSCLPGTW